MGQRGPKPLPANVHALRGNASKKPIAQFLDGVHPGVEIPPCPTHLTPDARIEWKRVASELEALGLICQIDRAALAAYCSAWAEVVTCERKITALNAKDADGSAGLASITPSAYQRAMADMGKAGLNPILAYSQGGASTPSVLKDKCPRPQCKLRKYKLRIIKILSVPLYIQQ